jgi:glyoxylase-like metal-dependent hydrolase (beta-lactamase superfamily II)
MRQGNTVLPEGITILFQGFPGKASRGFLGWSSVVLIDLGKKILFDAGNWSDREELIVRLDRHGLNPGDIDTIILSHLHLDHVANLPLFVNAQVIVSKMAFDNASGGFDDPYVPVWIAAHLRSIQERVRFVEGDTRIDDRIAILETPGHTPACISCIVREGDVYVALTGDAIKNAYDYVQGVAEMSYDEETSRNTIQKIREIANIVVPGHDRPFFADGTRIAYLSDATHEIKARANPYSDAWITFRLGFSDSDASGDTDV